MLLCAHCMSLLLVRNGPAGSMRRCPLIGVDRKWQAQGQNDAIDPKATFGFPLAILAAIAHRSSWRKSAARLLS
jgi:hypothetical protein